MGAAKPQINNYTGKSLTLDLDNRKSSKRVFLRMINISALTGTGEKLFTIFALKSFLFFSDKSYRQSASKILGSSLNGGDTIGAHLCIRLDYDVQSISNGEWSETAFNSYTFHSLELNK